MNCMDGALQVANPEWALELETQEEGAMMPFRHFGAETDGPRARVARVAVRRVGLPACLPVGFG